MTTRFTPGTHGTVRVVDQHSLDHFRIALEEQRRFRIEQLQELQAELPSHAGDTDPLSEVATALRTAATSALADVDAALARMNAGHYGHCVRCRHEVAIERLEIVPMASLCMNCQRAVEAETELADG